MQIRIAKNNFVDWQNEKNFIQNDPNFLFYQKGNYIKKWIEGQILDSENLDFYTKKLFAELSKFHQKKNQKITKFDWQIDEINDEKYKKLVQKYQFDPQVICHNDLQFKNIIVSKTDLYFIDFEWIRYNDPYFDYISLHLNLGISADKIIKFFGLSTEKFSDFIYLYKIFTNFWNKKWYV
ncbi:phosphotransferase [Mesomycoplasma ovipneumoniae]|uniref:phosphotransferase n=1 Tax=Mesomycoplasma ovipneumoniae TaxID=29562 RepID=UPI0026DCB582|nr:phosphotransferase [Mesomycoplasma ovipneumoniae]MDO4157971.1 phosphotransferase [Mesomycoplasma ovipneumoniae]MDO4158128.1 phosphotransferase [Mesomycoplasma ovipneumoniae]MDO6822047.1 phosphotransferase [Mesomycoplasma ovipneumoniae]MDO6855708.1 phosphotransferase [Mesomycoplasma ovipneumoniae]